MQPEMLYGIDTWVIGLGLLALLVAVPFLTYRAGARHRAAGHLEDPHLGTIIGSILGLLALLLGFTFSMAAGRYDNRRNNIVREANAIGTAYMRTDFLPEAQRGPSRKLLRDYVENRITLFEGRPNAERDTAACRESDRLQAALWNLAAAAGRAEPGSETLKLYIQSLNNALDMHDIRVSGMENHVPQIILVILFLTATSAIGLIGYGCGHHGKSHGVASFAISFLTVLVILLIIDLDRPRRGVIQVPPNSLERLRGSLRDAQ